MQEHPRIEAIDTTELQTAWSAAFPEHYGVSEEPQRAVDSFRNVVSRYIYAENHVVPLPHEQVGTLNPLGRLWCHSEDAVSPAASGSEITLSEDEVDHVLLELIKQTSAYADDYTQWLRFQLTEPISKEYASRTTHKGGTTKRPTDPIAEQLQDVRRLMEAGCFTTLLSRLDGLRLGGIHVKGAERLKAAPAVYAVAYLASHCVRGRKYAHQFETTETAYTAHWTRKLIAMNRKLDSEHDSDVGDAIEILWADILLDGMRSGVLSWTPEAFVKSLPKLRKAVRDRRDDSNLTSREEHVRLKARLDLLDEAGIRPALRGSFSRALSESQLKEVVQAVPSITSPSAAAVFRVIKLLGRMPGIHRAAERTHRLFLFNGTMFNGTMFNGAMLRWYKEAWALPHVIEETDSSSTTGSDATP